MFENPGVDVVTVFCYLFTEFHSNFLVSHVGVSAKQTNLIAQVRLD